VASEIVQDDDVACGEGRGEHLRNVSKEDFAVHGAVHDQRGGEAAGAQGGDKGRPSGSRSAANLALSFAFNYLILVNAKLPFAVYGWRHRNGSSRYDLCAQHRTERPS
jgi:hypothetical protein